jgi:hypothetical protein
MKEFLVARIKAKSKKSGAKKEIAAKKRKALGKEARSEIMARPAPPTKPTIPPVYEELPSDAATIDDTLASKKRGMEARSG